MEVLFAVEIECCDYLCIVGFVISASPDLSNFLSKSEFQLKNTPDIIYENHKNLTVIQISKLIFKRNPLQLFASADLESIDI